MYILYRPQLMQALIRMVVRGKVGKRRKKRSQRKRNKKTLQRLIL